LGITQDYLAPRLWEAVPLATLSLKDDVAMLSSGHPGAMPFVQRWCPGWRGQL
jgi:hypothetical protein